MMSDLASTVRTDQAQTTEAEPLSVEKHRGSEKQSSVEKQAVAQQELFASCLAGFEKALGSELRSFGAMRVRPLGGGVSFFASTEVLLRACLWSRLASRITLVVGRVNASDAHLLYEGVRRIAWEEVVAPGASIAVSAHGTNDELRNTQFSALKVKDGLCDRLREVRGERPAVDSTNPDVLLDVRIRENKATISLNLTGDSLYHRSYLLPDEGSETALGCAFAAGLLASADWYRLVSGKAGCVDPACSDGAVLIEAALQACDAAPSLQRTKWGFNGWAGMDFQVWDDLLAEADDRFEEGLSRFGVDAGVQTPAENPCFIGLSTSSPAIAKARSRVRRAQLRSLVSIELNEDNAPAQGVERVNRSLAERVLTEQSASSASTDSKEGIVLVASVLPNFDSAKATSFDARGAAEIQAVIQAASAGVAPCLCAVLSNAQFVARYGVEPQLQMRVGRDTISGQILVFDQPPQGMITLSVPDNAGGPEHSVEVFEDSSAQFAARLHKVAKERRKWARKEQVSCYRLYDSDLPDYAVAIELFEGAGNAQGIAYATIAEYAPPRDVERSRAQRRLQDVLTLVPVVLGIRPDHVFLRTRRRDKGGSQYQERAKHAYVTQVEESGYLFEVDFSSYLDTGIFLDHRLTRQMVGTMAKGKHFLNLFAYTGTATVHAAGGGAASTCTVDLSQTYLDWAKRNMELNGFTGKTHSFERGDVMSWITSCRRSSRRFDLIFVDPPTFSNSKAMGKRTWDVQRDHAELLIGVSRLLKEGGVAVFSCNLRSFKPDLDKLSQYGVEVEDITAKTIPHDFARNQRIHHCYLVRRVAR